MKCTVTKALVELKLLDKRINKLLANPITLATGLTEGETPAGYNTTEEFTAAAQAYMKKVTDLIGRQSGIKTAIVQSNAINQVNIPGAGHFTVAAAIEQKTKIDQTKTFIGILSDQYFNVLNQIERANSRVREQAHDRAVSAMGVKDGQVDKSDETYTKLIDVFLGKNLKKLVAPANLRQTLESLVEAVEAFEAGVDIALSESNATTYVEIPD